MQVSEYLSREGSKLDRLAVVQRSLEVKCDEAERIAEVDQSRRSRDVLQNRMQNLSISYWMFARALEGIHAFCIGRMREIERERRKRNDQGYDWTRCALYKGSRELAEKMRMDNNMKIAALELRMAFLSIADGCAK